MTFLEILHVSNDFHNIKQNKVSKKIILDGLACIIIVLYHIITFVPCCSLLAEFRKYALVHIYQILYFSTTDKKY